MQCHRNAPNRPRWRWPVDLPSDGNQVNLSSQPEYSENKLQYYTSKNTLSTHLIKSIFKRKRSLRSPKKLLRLTCCAPYHRWAPSATSTRRLILWVRETECSFLFFPLPVLLLLFSRFFVFGHLRSGLLAPTTAIVFAALR